VRWENIGIDVALASDCFFFLFFTDITLATFRSNKLVGGPIVTILPPHFFTFLTHVTSHALSFPHHLPRAPSMCLQITGLILAYVALTCIILFAHALVWFLMAVLRLLITFL
jgi:hypothetical protein